MNENNKEILNYLKQITLKDEERYKIETSKDNKKIIRINIGGKLIYLGSKYAVNRDIDTFKSTIKAINVNNIIIVWGFGTGEHIINLLNEASRTSKILIIEPDEKILIENILSNSIENIFEDDRVFIINYEKSNMKIILNEIIKDVEISNAEIVTYANYDKVYGKEYMEFSKQFIGFVHDSLIQISTSLNFSKQFFKCYARNIKKIVDSNIINKFKDKFKGMSAIIVSAGPSLEKNIHLLKDIQDKFIIITGGRTLNTLLEKGIKPDFVCSIDPGDASYKVIEKALNSDVPLVFSEVSNYKMVEEYEGEKIFFEDIDFKDTTDKLLGLEVDSLWQGGSVAHICISLGAYLGCGNIIFIGQDLAYTNNKYHVESASISKSNNIIENDNYIEVDDIYGKKVTTTKILDFYRKNIEEMNLVYKDVNFINSTEGGANIKGTSVKTLQQSIDEYSYSECIDKNLEDILSKKSLVNKQIVYKNIKKFIKSIENIEGICKSALVHTSRMYKYYDENILLDINYILGELDKIDSKLNKEVEKVQSIKKLYAPLVAKIMFSAELKEKQGESEKEKGKRLALKSEAIYKGLLEVMNYAKTEFEQVKKDLT
ncbi:DUF115 domain-containing protein [Clostridium sp. CS001]|uniref:motility associated factor glycosyltransferase family protein n=1 Tax=Clostridium sp. CS001 TaxID=2880648 RepID=UPI001CF0FCD2|nr:6-hydroxymethylpterin diphosphokinase MptE-like protein [Clostridium sp. CS001]MCB2288848.1 DUF115 domain-containing protein [Clostridium sp. CS001]